MCTAVIHVVKTITQGVMILGSVEIPNIEFQVRVVEIVLEIDLMRTSHRDQD